MQPKIELTRSEVMQAATVGIERRVESMFSGRNYKVHTRHSSWDTDISGSAAEMAVAKYLGVFFDGGVNTFKDPDIGGFQVRSTKHKSGHLIVRPNDKPEDIYIFVIGYGRNFQILGWMPGHEAKQDRYFRPRVQGESEAWWVPQSDLRCISELRAFKDRINGAREIC